MNYRLITENYKYFIQSSLIRQYNLTKLFQLISTKQLSTQQNINLARKHKQIDRSRPRNVHGRERVFLRVAERQCGFRTVAVGVVGAPVSGIVLSPRGPGAGAPRLPLPEKRAGRSLTPQRW